jgi:hypothetical protein
MMLSVFERLPEEVKVETETLETRVPTRLRVAMLTCSLIFLCHTRMHNLIQNFESFLWASLFSRLWTSLAKLVLSKWHSP